MSKSKTISEGPVAIMGLGKTGLSAAKFLESRGIEVWAWDDQESARAEVKSDGVKLKDLYLCNWSYPKFLILSPGIPEHYPTPHKVASLAIEHKCKIICDIDLLAQFNNEATFIGVTGTNGKSTTTSLIGHILDNGKRLIRIGGNLGVPAIDLEMLGKDGTYVLELSSYQLGRVPSLNLSAGVLLNISFDHLDRHGGLNGYIDAKKSIFQKLSDNGNAVIGIDDPYSRSIGLELMSKTLSKKVRVVPISSKLRAPGGVYCSGKYLIDDMDYKSSKIMDLTVQTQLEGLHNWQNIAAAYAIARMNNISSEDIIHGIETFPGLAHRQEFVRKIGKVTFVNDSKATNWDSAIKALQTYSSIYWIAGGRVKEVEENFVIKLPSEVKHAFLFGEDAGVISEIIGSQVSFQIYDDLEGAVFAAYELSKKSRATAMVLFSPGCSSFDQFKNFEERGDMFRQMVLEL